MQFKFNDGSSTEGEVVAKAMNVLIIKTDAGYYIVNRHSLASDDPYAIPQE